VSPEKEMKIGLLLTSLGLLALSDIWLAWTSNAWGTALFVFTIIILFVITVIWSWKDKRESGIERYLARPATIIVYFVLYGLIEYIVEQDVTRWANAIFFILVGLFSIIYSLTFSQKHKATS
jgi:putative flippase GtrA